MGPFGSKIKTDNFKPTGVPLVRGSNLKDGFVDDSFAFISSEKADELRNANAFPGDIVITHRGTLGQVGLIPEASRFPRYVVSQSQMLLSVAPGATPRYLYDYLRSARGQHALLANTSQTGVPAIARPTASVRAIRFVLPRLEVLAAFDALVGPLYQGKGQRQQEADTLGALRDALLPKLMSGELWLKNAERFLDTAASTSARCPSRTSGPSKCFSTWKGATYFNFSDRTFGDFVADAVGIDIHSEKYTADGTSKARKLRTFWRLESDHTVGKLLLALIEHAASINRMPDAEAAAQEDKCRQIATRLLSGGPRLSALTEHARTLDANYLAEQIRRLEASVETDPEPRDRNRKRAHRDLL